jgi:hypothetical protein
VKESVSSAAGKISESSKYYGAAFMVKAGIAKESAGAKLGPVKESASQKYAVSLKHLIIILELQRE